MRSASGASAIMAAIKTASQVSHPPRSAERLGRYRVPKSIDSMAVEIPGDTFAISDRHAPDTRFSP
jgi:hypothetical protein